MSEFFEPPPPQPKAELSEPDPPAWLGPEKASLPSAVPLAEVVAKNDAIAVGIGGVLAYPAGFQIQVKVIALDEEGLSDPFGRGYFDGVEGIPDQMLRVGFEYGEGRRSMNTRFHWHDGGADEDGQTPTMVSQGGSGGLSNWSQEFWCWPLPDAEKIHFVCEWPSVGIALTKHEIDGRAITDAAARAISMLASE